MDGLISAFKINFAPKVTADKVIWHAAHGLANPPEISRSSQVVIDVMTSLHLNTLPLFDKLYDYFNQPSSYDPNELKLLATLGCKVAMAPIYSDPTINERYVTIELGETNDPHSTLGFIEKRETDGSGKSQVFVKDYTGVEKPCPERFTTLEDIVAFYKEDLTENKNGIYSQHVSKDLFIDSTLGVALHHYGSDSFDEYDVSNVKKWFGLPPDYPIELEELRNPALQYDAEGHFSEQEVTLLLQIIKNQLRHSDKWEVASLVEKPVITIDGTLTLQDIYEYVTSPIRTQAEDEARRYILAHMNLGPITQSYFVEMASIYALAEASLTPEQQQFSRSDRRDDVESCIRANHAAIYTLRMIFGFGRPNSMQDLAYRQAIRDSFPVSPPGVPDEQAKNLKWALFSAIEWCYRALSDEYYTNLLESRGATLA